MEKFIAKQEGKNVVLFFPEYTVNPGMIQHWDGCHGEASLPYFWSLKPAHDAARVAEAVRIYEMHYKTELRRVYRDSRAMRSAREV